MIHIWTSVDESGKQPLPGMELTTQLETDLSTGCSVDWAKKTYNTKLTLTYEMRDTGRYGFLLSPEQIIPSAEEFLDGFAVAIAELRAGIVTPDLPPDVL
ncbi:unnamed protein product [Allacma fusca]|uniref:Peptidase M14 domain-containing protein n=1 Tax=Allacma fusca TaxID=39272 RepID=A0A8J2JHK9_9HEXA|nr:unnamed protein product [Allacma fusca]